MTRHVTVGAAQMGPVGRDETREQVVERLLALLHDAADRGCDLVVYPELALTTFFPRWHIEDEAEILTWFETEMPGPATKPLFDEAARLGIGFSLGHAEFHTDDDDGTTHRYNTQILVERDGSIVGKYRKIHIPGHEEHEAWRPSCETTRWDAAAVTKDEPFPCRHGLEASQIPRESSTAHITAVMFELGRVARFESRCRRSRSR